MKTGFFLASVLPLLATASPLVERAGGPIAKKIPSSCTVTNPLPGSNGGKANVNGYKPSPSFIKEHLLYQAYFPPPAGAKKEGTICAEQCYGYGNPGECKSSFFAFDIPQPGGLSAGCLLFKAPLETDSFVPAKQGTYTQATAADISCPK